MINNFFKMQKGPHISNRPRQRQRMSRKMILILGSSIVCLVIAFTIVINLTDVDSTQAAIQGKTSNNVIIIPDQDYQTAVTVTQPAAQRSDRMTPNVQLGRTAKPLR